VSEKVRKSCPECASVLSVSKTTATKAVLCPKCSKTVPASELFILLSDGKIWAITKSELKYWAANLKVQPHESVSLDGSSWRKLSDIPGLFATKVAPASPNRQLTAPKKLTPPARQPQQLQPPVPNPLSNPIAALLNTLVTERLEELQEKVQRGEIDAKQFEAKGRRLLEQLLAAIEAFPGGASPRDTEHGTSIVEKSKSILPPPRAAAANRSATRQHDQASLAGLESSVRSPEPTGIGSVAKLAGAAILGGAFGYLLANQRVHAGQYGGTDFHPMSGGWEHDYDRNTVASDIGHGDSHAAMVIDSNADGVVDLMPLDQNSDGVADFVAHDNDGDGLIDSFEVDADLDGTFDQRFVEDPSFAPSENIESDGGGADDGLEMTGEMLAEVPEDVMGDDEVDSELSSELDSSLENEDDFQSDDAGFDDDAGLDDGFGMDMDMEF